ncbi:MAG TPA: M15 family metallopeptidase [Chthoniobacterales bacterium]
MLACVFAFAIGLHAAPEPELVDIRKVDPTIVVELRYAGSRNIAQRPIYPEKMPALVRPGLAAQLVVAQNYLRERGFRLKIWDAYRPKAAHEQLWQLYPNKAFVANPADGIGSLHTWGVAVDATLVDDEGRDVLMPTDFDEFTPAAVLRYAGGDALVRTHLHTLQRAMARAGFFGMRTEWWHFVAKNWEKYRAIDPPPAVAEIPPAPAIPVSQAAARTRAMASGGSSMGSR